MPTLDKFDEITRSNRFSRSEWFSPTDGENKIRVLSNEFAVLPSHYIPSMRKSFTCFGKENGCPHDMAIKVLVRDEDGKPTFQIDGKTPVTEEKIVHRPGLKYLLWVIDRKDGKVKIGKFTYGVVKMITDFKSSEEYGYENLPVYDIIVKRTKTGPDPKDVEYSVIPSRIDTSLTEKEQEELKTVGSLEEIVNRMKEKEQRKIGINSISSSQFKELDEEEVEIGEVE